jgi:hypothetical protein
MWEFFLEQVYKVKEPKNMIPDHFMLLNGVVVWAAGIQSFPWRECFIGQMKQGCADIS